MAAFGIGSDFSTSTSDTTLDSESSLVFAATTNDTSDQTTNVADAVVKKQDDSDQQQNTKHDSLVETVQEFTREDVSNHSDFDDCYVIIKKIVYDVTNFIDDHPGGLDVIMEFAGGDATTAFQENGHSKHAYDLLENFKIGVIVKGKKESPTLQYNT
jgi:cytochrome b involved in lipid metabolism